LPDGRRKTLVEIPDWDMNWQAVYYYRSPVELPKGTVVSMRWIYDNSASNVRNPNHPPKRVKAGNEASDEMAHLWLQVLPKNGNDGRLAIQRALMQARLRKYPGDFVAHFNLGAVLLSEKKAEQSISHFRAALKASPQSPAARTSLGAALESLGQSRAAMVEYGRAIDADPQYLDARYNLANLLAARREFSGAIAQYREIRKQRPEDSTATAKLSLVLQAEGDTLASSGRIPDAITRYREAVDLAPGDADAHNNLGSSLAISGDLKQALTHFEAAVRIRPDHDQARNNLNLARTKLAGSQR
jgi:Flp pilus assembly protein TadD